MTPISIESTLAERKSHLCSLVRQHVAATILVMTENIISASQAQNIDGYVERKQKYVKRQFQQSMLLQTLLCTFIIINVIVMAIFWAIDSFADLQQFKIYLACTIALLELAGFITLYRLNLEASHRIAGPIYSIERFLQTIETGNLAGTLELRKTDQFPETAEQLNTTLKSVRNRINRAQYLATKIQQQPEDAALLTQQLVEELAFFNTTDSTKRG